MAKKCLYYGYHFSNKTRNSFLALFFDSDASFVYKFKMAATTEKR